MKKNQKLAAAAVLAVSAMLFTGCAAGTAPTPAQVSQAAPNATAPIAPYTAPPMDDDGGAAAGTGEDGLPSVMGLGQYGFLSEAGVVGEFTLWGKAPAHLESLRLAAGAAPVTYVSVSLDARQATDGSNMYEMDLFDPDGNKYVFQSADTVIGEWADTIDMDDYALYNRFADAANDEPYYVDRAEKGTIVMIYEGTKKLPSEFSRVAVQPLGMGDDVDAWPIQDGAS